MEGIKFNNIELLIQSLGDKYIKAGIRKKSSWEVFVSRKHKYIYLGSYFIEQNAINSKIEFLCDEFLNNIKLIDCSISDIYQTEHYGYFVTNKGHIINKFGLELKGCINKYGYRQNVLSKNNKAKIVLAHRLILKSISPIENFNLYDVNHKDGNKLNNIIDNLEWCTRSENVLHSFKNGLQNNIAGNPIITNEEKEYIRKNLYTKTSIEIGKELNRKPRTIRRHMKKMREEF